MKTEVLKASEESIKKAAEIIKSGGVVGVPTETVYGLGANALSSDAVGKIFEAKGRPKDNPMIVHVSCMEEIIPLVENVPEKAKLLAEKFWPGPLTIIMKKTNLVPSVTSGNLDTVAIRMPSHEVMRKIIKESGCPIAAPSANLSGSPSPTNAKYVYDDMNGKIPLIIDGGESNVGLESTVITLVGEKPRLLRPGGVTPEELCEVLGEIEIDKAVKAKLEENQKASSPGMKYKHYAPKIKVVIIKADTEKYIEYISSQNKKVAALCFEDEKEKITVPCVTYGKSFDASSQAKRLFDALRELDKTDAEIAYAHCPSEEGVGLAVYNRLLRSAGFDVIEL
ncbi:MAG: threonylcarbamoyl-AMP synthase [Ruminococcaceae bacterium]|nr:threonylcarbamoyl-AMP synthase [Oscillospiraceae bacterium]